MDPNAILAKLESLRGEDGRFPSYAWPGGYPIYAITADGDCLCIACANGDNGSEASTDPDAPADWRIEAVDVYWEGPVETCGHCNAAIESAYGDPDD